MHRAEVLATRVQRAKVANVDDERASRRRDADPILVLRLNFQAFHVIRGKQGQDAEIVVRAGAYVLFASPVCEQGRQCGGRHDSRRSSSP